MLNGVPAMATCDVLGHASSRDAPGYGNTEHTWLALQKPAQHGTPEAHPKLFRGTQHAPICLQWPLDPERQSASLEQFTSAEHVPYI